MGGKMNDLFSLIITVCLGTKCDSSIDEHNVTLDDCNTALLLEASNNKLTTQLYYELIENNPKASTMSLSSHLECIAVDVE